MFLLPTVHTEGRSLCCIWSGPNKGTSIFHTVLSRSQQVCAAGFPGNQSMVFNIPITKIPQAHHDHLSAQEDETELGSFTGATRPKVYSVALQLQSTMELRGGVGARGLLKHRLLASPPDFWIQRVWGDTQESVFLTSSQMLLILMTGDHPLGPPGRCHPDIC